WGTWIRREFDVLPDFHAPRRIDTDAAADFDLPLVQRLQGFLAWQAKSHLHNLKQRPMHEPSIDEYGCHLLLRQFTRPGGRVSWGLCRSKSFGAGTSPQRNPSLARPPARTFLRAKP